jgi:hypothetical protein
VKLLEKSSYNATEIGKIAERMEERIRIPGKWNIKKGCVGCHEGKQTEKKKPVAVDES